MEVFKKILNITFRVFLLLILLVLVTGVTCNLVLNIQRGSGEARPNIFGLAPITITDNNLAPDVKENDFIIISNTGNYEIGDIVTIEKGGEFYTQKIVGVKYYEGREDIKYFVLSNFSTATPQMIYGEVSIKLDGFAPFINFFQTNFP